MANKTGIHTGALETKTVLIDSNLTGKEYHFVSFDATDDDVVNLAETQALPPYVLLEAADGSSTVKEGSIALYGRTKLKISETVAPGKFLVPGTGGLGEVADAAGERYGVIALTGGVANDIIEVEIMRGEVEASDA